ncbi:MAG: TIGR03862 family flavoprotein [Alphaproteobacteria bacterium]|nr:TIGR03862 family flavoprotein [Alphaproteobacteria bacterium]
MSHPSAIVIGAGPAGLMAAEMMARHSLTVSVYDWMPSPGRKLMRAGIGGLNLTHSEPAADFLTRYGSAAGWLAPMLAQFGPDQLRGWAAELGIDTFVGSSGRVFPVGMKAAPLLRAWLRRLQGLGVSFLPRHRWLGWNSDGTLRFDAAPSVASAVTVLALGGASWPRLGSDGVWADILAARGVAISPFCPSNCGFEVGWSDFFKDRFAGTPIKPAGLSFQGRSLKGEFMITRHGIEGGAIYALSAALRDATLADGQAVLTIDLKPDWSLERLTQALDSPRGSRSLATHLDKVARLKGAQVALLREGVRELPTETARLAARIKAVPLTLTAPRPLAEAISTAGGIGLEQVDDGLMLKALPGVFVAGEMLDWEAPTGGYLLTACLAQGRWAGLAAAKNAADKLGSTQK